MWRARVEGDEARLGAIRPLATCQGRLHTVIYNKLADTSAGTGNVGLGIRRTGSSTSSRATRYGHTDQRQAAAESSRKARSIEFARSAASSKQRPSVNRHR